MKSNPQAYVRKTAAKAGISMSRAEHLWDVAKEAATRYGRPGSDRYWAAVTGIFRNIVTGMRSNPASIKADLEKMFGRRNDTFWGIRETREGSEFKSTGISGVQCTGFAREIERKLPGRIQVFGFHEDDNPSSRIARDLGGHDFAVVDGRYIVDPWAAEVESYTDHVVHDLEDPGDAAIIKDLYGNPKNWRIMP